MKEKIFYLIGKLRTNIRYWLEISKINSELYYRKLFLSKK